MPVSSASASTWNPAFKGTSITLSNGNLTATATSTSSQAVLGTLSQASGKVYFEVYVGSVRSNTIAVIGIATSSQATNSYLQVGVYPNGYVVQNGAYITTVNSYSSNATVGVAYDGGTGKLWFATNNSWSGSPSAGTGQPITLTAGTIYFPGVSTYTLNDAFTLHTAASNQTYTPPAGFSPWG